MYCVPFWATLCAVSDVMTPVALYMILTDVAFVRFMFSVTELAADDAIVMLRAGFGPPEGSSSPSPQPMNDRQQRSVKMIR